jgi:hypothetical protein
MVMIAKHTSSFQTKWPGNSPARILVKMLAMVGSWVTETGRIFLYNC